jgi:hypothetical protein
VEKKKSDCDSMFEKHPSRSACRKGHYGWVGAAGAPPEELLPCVGADGVLPEDEPPLLLCVGAEGVLDDPPELLCVGAEGEPPEEELPPPVVVEEEPEPLWDGAVGALPEEVLPLLLWVGAEEAPPLEDCELLCVGATTFGGLVELSPVEFVQLSWLFPYVGATTFGPIELLQVEFPDETVLFFWLLLWVGATTFGGLVELLVEFVLFF